MKHHFCQFVPTNIIEKLPIDESDIELSKFFHENRRFLLAHPELKKRRRVTHKETRNLFDSANQYKFADKPAITEEQIQRTRTHKYNIISTISTTKTHKYDQGGKLVVSKTHKYDIGEPIVLQELGGSTNAFIRFPERVRIIDIIADLNNLAIANVQIPVSQPPANIAIAVVVIAEYIHVTEGGFLLPRTASSQQILLNRLESRQIIPPIIESVENRVKCDHIAIEILPLDKLRLLAHSNITIEETAKSILLAKTQIKQDEKTKIKIASATTLQETQITKIASIANLQIPYNLSNALVKIPEIMTRERAKTIKTLIDLLNSDILFE